jgi:hypothetical protein
MKLFINFIAFWMLMIYAISKGDLFGIIMSLVGFLIMMKFIEDLEENNLQETIWLSKEVTLMDTSLLKKEPNKVD